MKRVVACVPAALLVASAATAFETPAPSSLLHRPATGRAATAVDEMFETAAGDETVPSTPPPPAPKRGKIMSQAIPFLECPKVLAESDLAGGVGFDPLGFAKNKELLWQYREAEIKHARLAMLAAVGWPVSELLDRNIADYFNAPSMLDDGDRVPTVLNGGMDRISPQFWGFCLGLCASIDMYGVAKARKGEADYFPGNLGFDPLNFYAVDKDGQKSLQTAEIKHGRVAMLGVVGYAAEEYTTQLAVIEDTPILFQPITESIEEALLEAVQFEEAIAGAL